MLDLTDERPDKQQYSSLPRPGKHGTTSKPLKAVKNWISDEQAKIAKSGLEMKMMSSEMDAETEKWQGADENNDIVKRAKKYVFHGLRYVPIHKRLYKIVRQFSYQVPAGTIKKELLEHLDKVPTYVQQLQFTVKEPTVGRAATFSKVDNVIQETKHLMNVISKVVTTCFDCANKGLIPLGQSDKTKPQQIQGAIRTNWTSRVCRLREQEEVAPGTRRLRAEEGETRSPGGAPRSRPCDSTAWAGAARATRAGPESASSCFKTNVLKLVATAGRTNG
ncbi:unnamed protein product [Danaus chrysippus]|uniref:(African queen) hypothetical protein n=1 Tax=Danaus chrysippus TaxID=151541 RepID=A0A8J2R5K7_9NEOP|nr:unnamed protein product [Danaus chrysippus]